MPRTTTARERLVAKLHARQKEIVPGVEIRDSVYYKPQKEGEQAQVVIRLEVTPGKGGNSLTEEQYNDLCAAIMLEKQNTSFKGQFQDARLSTVF